MALLGSVCQDAYIVVAATLVFVQEIEDLFAHRENAILLNKFFEF